MGASESKLDASRRSGLHCLRVADQSPSAEAGIEPFFDYVMGVNGRPLNDDPEVLAKAAEEAEGSSLTLQIWSSKRQELRDVRIHPNRQWSALLPGEANQADLQPSLLGLSLRLCHPEGALQNVWHVLDILEGSPAESAGFVPFGDYILGYAGGVLRKESDFYDLIEKHIDTPLRLFVYNLDFDVTREVVIVPNREWSTSGEGLLGCSIGFGPLHRIPKPSDRVEEEDRNNSSTPPRPRVTPRPDANGILVSDGVSVSPAAETPPPARLGKIGNNTTKALQYSYRQPPVSPSSATRKSSVAQVIVEEED